MPTQAGSHWHSPLAVQIPFMLQLPGHFFPGGVGGVGVGGAGGDGGGPGGVGAGGDGGPSAMTRPLEQCFAFLAT